MVTLIHKALIRIVAPFSLVMFIFNRALGGGNSWDGPLLVLLIAACMLLFLLNPWGRICWILMTIWDIGQHLNNLRQDDYFNINYYMANPKLAFNIFPDVWFLLIVSIYLFLPPVSRVFADRNQ